VVSSWAYRLNGNKPSLEETLFLIILDIPPCIIAILLVYSRNKTDRVNGWIKLIIELIGFILLFVVVYAAIALKSTYK
jgi:multisubunit Na+/H+ antiporter MnhF subunit